MGVSITEAVMEFRNRGTRAIAWVATRGMMGNQKMLQRFTLTFAIIQM